MYKMFLFPCYSQQKRGLLLHNMQIVEILRECNNGEEYRTVHKVMVFNISRHQFFIAKLLLLSYCRFQKLLLSSLTFIISSNLEFWIVLVVSRLFKLTTHQILCYDEFRSNKHINHCRMKVQGHDTLLRDRTFHCLLDFEHNFQKIGVPLTLCYNFYFSDKVKKLKI